LERELRDYFDSEQTHKEIVSPKVAWSILVAYRIVINTANGKGRMNTIIRKKTLKTGSGVCDF
jgi:hypothetical protein